MLVLPSTRQIQFLAALKKKGSFHKAAAFCGVTQSTVSAAIKDMEGIVGAPLVDRTNRRKTAFTPLGEEMAAKGEKILADLAAISQRARHMREPLSSPLRLGIIQTVAPYLLPRILRPLHAKFPRLRLQIIELQSAPLIKAVHDGDVDCGIIAFPFDTGELATFPLMEEAFYCAGARGTFGTKKLVNMTDISGQKLLLLEDGQCLRDHALAACQLKAAPGAQDTSATSLATLIQLVAQGYGVTLLPEMVFKDAPLPANVEILPIARRSIRRIGGIARPNTQQAGDIAALMGAIRGLVAA